MKWFTIELAPDLRSEFFAMLMGLPEFARILLAHVPKSVIDDEAYALLRETEQGRPPSVWGENERTDGSFSFELTVSADRPSGIPPE